MDIPFGHNHHAYRHIGLFVLMIGQHGIKIHAVNMVARKNNYLIRWVILHKINILPDGICRAPVPVRILFTSTGRQDFDAAGAPSEIPGFTITNMSHERQGLVLC